jgi:hypothetical protein
MATCSSLATLARECGKNVKTGLNSDVYLIAFDDLAQIAGSTEKYSMTAGLVSAIGVTGSNKFVKYGSVINQNSIKEDTTQNDNGTSETVIQLTFSLSNMGSVDVRNAVGNLIGNPVAALVKMKTGTWLAFGLNGYFMAKTIAGTIDSGSNGRTITLSGSDFELSHIVDPTIVASLIA